MLSFTAFLDPTTLFLGAAVAFVLIWIYMKRPKNFPPGPRGLPFVGYAPYLGQNPPETLMKLKKTYGPVMSVQMGRETWVVLNDFATIHEALVKNGEKFSGRPSNFFFDIFSQGCGVTGVDYGPTWKAMRKFGSSTLRGFGVGTKSMEQNVIEEAGYLIDSLSFDYQNHRHKIMMAVSNIICRIVFGSRFEYDDNRFLILHESLDTFFSDSVTAKLVGVILFEPLVRYLPFFRGALRIALTKREKAIGVLKEIVEEHKQSFIKNDMRDFIDAFLKEIHDKGEGDPSFNEQHLLAFTRDLFEAGTGTTSSTLHWCIFAFCHFPESQEKIAKEIEKAIGMSGTPTMNHRDAMPFTCAFIHEIMRLKTLVPLSVFHKTNEDCTLEGYNIPKNTTITPNLWAVHHDPEYFPEPDTFKPERFLDKNGKFITSKFVIPFSVGYRYCLGEQLARMEVFIFLTSIVQKFEVMSDPKSKLPEFENSGQSSGLQHEGPDFAVIFKKR